MPRLSVLLGLTVCCSAGCSPELPEEPNDFEVVKSDKNGTKGEDDTEGYSKGSDEEVKQEERTGPTTPEPTADAGSPTTDGGASPLPRNTVLLDGKPMAIATSEAHVNRYGAFVTVDFTGENAPAKTQVILNFQKTGSGCVSGAKAQGLFLYPGGSSSNAYRSTDGPACGLEVTAFPAAVGDVAAGTFKGTIEGLNGVAGKTRTLEMTFAVKSIAQP